MEHTVEAPCSASGSAVLTALHQLIGSETFVRSQRMIRLLSFLVEKQLAGAVRDTSEYAIGIEVFGRDPATYSTCADPIVRVQVGRLREKLKHYYAAEGAQAPLRFSIPVGSYMPEIRPMNKPPALARTYLLAILPLAVFSADAETGAFARGLDEELAYQLYHTFGQTIVAHTFGQADEAAINAVSHRLEGSVRVDGQDIRVSMRLIDRAAGCISWSHQFDTCPPFAISLQEHLALSICAALELYFALG